MLTQIIQINQHSLHLQYSAPANFCWDCCPPFAGAIKDEGKWLRLSRPFPFEKSFSKIVWRIKD